MKTSTVNPRRCIPPVSELPNIKPHGFYPQTDMTRPTTSAGQGHRHLGLSIHLRPRAGRPDDAGREGEHHPRRDELGECMLGLYGQRAAAGLGGLVSAGRGQRRARRGFDEFVSEWDSCGRELGQGADVSEGEGDGE